MTPKQVEAIVTVLTNIEVSLGKLVAERATQPKEPVPVRPPEPMRITCENCGELHIDVGEFATKPHHTHTCQHCGLTWRPAIFHTVGVRFLPGFRNGA
jgi:predicted RNA-binding Zn-ribbon protein involved in translation (DUF1610 family)